MPVQNSLSDRAERLIHDMIKRNKFEITDHISCYYIKRCDDCPLQGQNCIFARKEYEFKYYPELSI